MIAYLKGIILAKTADALIIVNHDVGYEAKVPATLWRQVSTGDEIMLSTHEYQREDSRELYGFASFSEREFFRKLISISGVGPKIALHVCSLGSLGEIQTAIATGNVAFLTAIPGIGRKTAQKIVLELKGKLDFTENDGVDTESIDALVSLGYSPSHAREALQSVSPEISDISERVRAALKVLGQKVR
ncbi:MAG: Holliday junction branch migration protein RuvA [bacterium]|nr:Holliday junction branch migration protein RuvA [bacterium]